jgi:hypothetical protein
MSEAIVAASPLLSYSPAALRIKHLEPLGLHAVRPGHGRVRRHHTSRQDGNPDMHRAFTSLQDRSMNNKVDKELQALAQKTVEHLTSKQGRDALRAAAAGSKKTVAAFRSARNVDPQRLNRRFTV